MTTFADPPVLSYNKTELRALVEHASAEFEGVPAAHVLFWAAAIFGDKLAVAASMQDAVVPHLVSETAPGVDVLFIETGYHFAETLETRDRVARQLPITVRNLTATTSVAEQDAAHGPRLHDRDPDVCCFLRKVNPLAEALTGYSAWVGGGRRADGPSRADLRVVQWDSKHDLVKINPVVAWTDAEVEDYQVTHDLPRHPMIGDDFPSIGCAPCTSRVMPGEDARAGRWSGHEKTECGLYS